MCDKEYSGMLYVGSNSEGIHLSVMKLFAVGHPDLLIPWNVVEDLGDFSMVVRFRSLQVQGVKIWIREEVWQTIIEQRKPQE